MLPQEKLDLILRRHAEISDRLAAGPESSVFVALSRELAEIDAVAAAIQEYRAERKDIAGLEAILADPALKKQLLDLGIDARASTPDQLAARLKADVGKWKAVIDASGIEKQ